MIAELALLILMADAPTAAQPDSGFAIVEEATAEEQALYSKGTAALDRRDWSGAVDAFSKLASLKGDRADAALYWRAYALSKGGQRDDALRSIATLRSSYPRSRWIKDAAALELEVRQASGQSPAIPEKDGDDLKLLALGGLMQADPSRAMPIIVQMLSGPSPDTVKDRALFVLAQSASPEARAALLNIARNDGDPALQAKGVHYLGLFGGTESRQALLDVYAAAKNPEVRKAVLNGLMIAGDRGRLAEIARTDQSPELRHEATKLLGVAGGKAELAQLYKQQTGTEDRRAALMGLFVAGAVEQVTALAQSETDPELRAEAIQQLGLMGPTTTPTLKAIFAAEKSPELRKAVVRAFFVQNNATALIEIARQEKDPEVKRDVVRTLSLMQTKEATDFMLELLK